MEDVWQRTLQRIPSLFGRLAYLASLRDETSGRYRHFGLARMYGDDEADIVLRVSHERVFAEWLNLSLERQRGEIERHLDQLDEDRRTVLAAWGALQPYAALPPAAAGEAERVLYLSDLEIILEILRRDAAS